MKLEKAMLCCSTQMSKHATFCLLTLLLLLGLTLGFWWARPDHSALSGAGASATRGGTATSLCTHASIALHSDTTVRQLSQLLRAEDAHVLYGPDEFGDYQVRFGSGTLPAQAIERLQSRPEVAQLTAHPACQ